MSLSKHEWKRVEVLIANLQSRNARLSEMEKILTSFHDGGYPGCFDIAIASKNPTAMSRLLKEYPACFRLVQSDCRTGILLMRTVALHKYRAIRDELWKIPMTIRMRGSTFHLTLQ